MSFTSNFAKQTLLSSRSLHLRFDELFGNLKGNSTKPILFNLDLHIGVMRDLQQELERTNFRTIRWSISGSNNFARKIYRISDPVEIINSQTWHKLSEDLISRFEERYGKFLRKFDGFVVTHTPAFSQLYRSFEKPILTINSTGYEAPYTDDIKKWDNLNSYMLEATNKKRILLVSNNAGDSDYLKYKSGISTEVFPSYCDYTNLNWAPGGKHKVIIARSPVIEDVIEKLTGGEWKGIRKILGNNYKWKQYLDIKEILYIPYNISTMSLFEFATAGIPITIPSKKLLIDLHSKYQGVLSELSYFQIRNLSTDGLDINDPNNYESDYFLHWWLDRADFYNRELMPNVKIISGFDEINFERFTKPSDFSAFREQVEARNQNVKESRARLIKKFVAMI
jgi:hypothetical protein